MRQCNSATVEWEKKGVQTMGRALDYGVAMLALWRVVEDVCRCEKPRARCKDCPAADAFDALGRLVGSDPTFDPAEAVAAIFGNGNEEEGGGAPEEVFSVLLRFGRRR